MKTKRYMKIVNAVDIYGEKFIPKHPYYDVIYTHEKFVALGIDGHVMHKIAWENVEECLK